jgi:uridine kinase
LGPLGTGEAFAYRPYDCQKGELSGPVTVIPKPITVIEGVYSLHPKFFRAYGITVFLSIDRTVQHRRLAEREPRLLDRFINEWLPMENRYFDTFNIREKCDFLFEGELPL